MRKSKILIIFLSFFIFYILYFILFKSLRSSLFFQKKDRVNVVFYDKQTSFFSLGIDDDVNYILTFFPDLELLVPGGYGFYRVGALQKLITLEKKPNLLQKTFSLNTATFTDFYFYPGNNDIYYGAEKENSQSVPNWKKIFTDKSNINLFDRVYLYLFFTQNSLARFKSLSFYQMDNKTDFKNYQGFFYKKTYRTERKNVQIIYTNSYKTALAISHMIEGEGVRVVDLSESNKRNKCRVVEDAPHFSQTSQILSGFFQCELKHGKTEMSDIILELGDKEGEWEVN